MPENSDKPDEEALRREIVQRVEKHDAESPYRLNPDERVVAALIKGLVRRKVQFGDYYCPCRVVTGDADVDRRNVCPCETHGQEIAETGKCHCGLFVGDRKQG
ncbi:MAG TPA: ferredoxin-thioredoxin reductase catalytic domain-containing protein [Phycisphaerae bacterium]|nr:ferredoxin-thioredoxin reductase catalytic domain-containing protein [Phycisphaerae bacterium]